MLHLLAWFTWQHVLASLVLYAAGGFVFSPIFFDTGDEDIPWWTGHAIIALVFALMLAFTGILAAIVWSISALAS